MNEIITLVLFDLGTTRSFVSLAFSKRFGDAPREIDYPLEVEITNGRPLHVSRFH